MTDRTSPIRDRKPSAPINLPSRKNERSGLIFDLSEVLISGLVGIERQLCHHVPASEDQILPCFGGPLLDELLLGNISEDTYLKAIVLREGWGTDISRLKEVIRNNFHNQVAGMLDILAALAPDHELALLSDHAEEWIAYIKSIHPFLSLFKRTFFSYELGELKRNPEAFSQVLKALSIPARRCLFIDDNPANVAVAQSVGLPGICFVDAEQLVSELQRWGVW
jgi:phosphoglycolate phosphatase-like HAD superfamily hydrolase